MKTLLFSRMNSELFDTFKTNLSSISTTIKSLQDRETSLVFITNESKYNVLKWQKRLDFHAPFIVENGSAIYIPKDYDKLVLSSYPTLNGWHCIVLGKSHDFISAYLSTIKEKYGIRILSSSKTCEFSQTFSMKDPLLAPILNEEASLFGLSIKKRDRVFYALGKGASEDGALQIFKAFYRKCDYETEFVVLENDANSFLGFRLELENYLLKN